MPSHNLRLSDELFAAVNEAAGDVPRNTWIVRAIERALDDGAREIQVVTGRQAGRTQITRVGLSGWVPRATPEIPESMHGPQIKPLGKGPVAPRPKGKK